MQVYIKYRSCNDDEYLHASSQSRRQLDAQNLQSCPIGTRWSQLECPLHSWSSFARTSVTSSWINHLEAEAQPLSWHSLALLAPQSGSDWPRNNSCPWPKTDKSSGMVWLVIMFRLLQSRAFAPSLILPLQSISKQWKLCPTTDQAVQCLALLPKQLSKGLSCCWHIYLGDQKSRRYPTCKTKAHQ